MAQIKMQYGGGSLTPKVRPLYLYKNGVVSDKLGSIGVNRVATTDVSGSWSQEPTYIELISTRTSGSGGKSFSLDFQDKVEAQKYKYIKMTYDIIINASTPSTGGGAYINILRSTNNYIRQAQCKYIKNGPCYDQVLMMDISDITEDFYLVVNSYCYSSSGTFTTTVRIKELVLLTEAQNITVDLIKDDTVVNDNLIDCGMLTFVSGSQSPTRNQNVITANSNYGFGMFGDNTIIKNLFTSYCNSTGYTKMVIKCDIDITSNLLNAQTKRRFDYRSETTTSVDTTMVTAPQNTYNYSYNIEYELVAIVGFNQTPSLLIWEQPSSGFSNVTATIHNLSLIFKK